MREWVWCRVITKTGIALSAIWLALEVGQGPFTFPAWLGLVAWVLGANALASAWLPEPVLRREDTEPDLW